MMPSNLVREISLRFIDHPVWTVDGQLLIASDVSLTVNAEVLTTQYHTSHTDKHIRWTMPRSWQHNTTLHTQIDTVDGQLLIASDVSLTVNAEVLTTQYHTSHTDRHSRWTAVDSQWRVSHSECRGPDNTIPHFTHRHRHSRWTTVDSQWRVSHSKCRGPDNTIPHFTHRQTQ